jgi:hypothetical protein
MMHQTSQLGNRMLILPGAVWGIAVMIGLSLLFDYQTTPGAIGSPPMRWPTSDRIIPAKNRLHLVMVAHAHCPCTRAGVEALARIMAHSQNRATASVIFPKPKGAPHDWEQTDLWRSAAAIPGVQVVCDEDGHLARRFGVKSSGHVLLYDDNGQRIFSGGITAGRGHHGDNAGLNHCISLINGETTVQSDTPVYGCSILDPPDADVDGEGK